MDLDAIQRIDDDEATQLTLLLNSFDSGSTGSLTPTKQKYFVRISSSGYRTVDLVKDYRDISQASIDTVAAELAGKKMEDLKYPRNNDDVTFAEIALLAAKKVQMLGGDDEQMLAAALSVLTCRFYAENKGIELNLYQKEEFARVVAEKTVPVSEKEVRKIGPEGREQSQIHVQIMEATEEAELLLDEKDIDCSREGTEIIIIEDMQEDVSACGDDDMVFEEEETISKTRSKQKFRAPSLFRRKKFTSPFSFKSSSLISIILTFFATKAIRNKKDVAHQAAKKITASTMAEESIDKKLVLEIQDMLPENLMYRSEGRDDMILAEAAFLASYSVKKLGGSQKDIYKTALSILRGNSNSDSLRITGKDDLSSMTGSGLLAAALKKDTFRQLGRSNVPPMILEGPSPIKADSALMSDDAMDCRRKLPITHRVSDEVRDPPPGSPNNNPQLVYSEDVEVTSILALSRVFKKEEPSIVMLAFVMKAASLAMKQHPTVNATTDSSGINSRIEINHNFSVAISTGNRVVYPVIKHCDLLNVNAIINELKYLHKQAQSSPLPLFDEENGTFCISNVEAGTYTTPILVEPMACSATIGRIRRVPRFVSETSSKVKAASMMPLSISANHNVINGIELAQFFDEWKTCLENTDSGIAKSIF